MTFQTARLELERINWTDLRTPAMPGEAVAEVFRHLFDATQQSDAIGYSLEQTLEVQSMVFEVALPAIGVILAAFTEELPTWLEMELLNVLHSVITGEPHHSEVALGNDALVERCVDKARDGLWVMYSRLSKVNYDFLLDILEEVDHDVERYRSFRQYCERRWG